MIKKLSGILLKTVTNSLLLVGVTLIVWYFKKDSGLSLNDTLFWVGAAPIVLFSLTFFGGFMGRANFGYQYSGSIINKSSNQKAQEEGNDMKSRFISNLAWILAGALLWTISYFI